MFKKYDNVYIKHNSYTDARKISGKVGYIADVAQDMYTVKIPHKTGFRGRVRTIRTRAREPRT